MALWEPQTKKGFLWEPQALYLRAGTRYQWRCYFRHNQSFVARCRSIHAYSNVILRKAGIEKAISVITGAWYPGVTVCRYLCTYDLLFFFDITTNIVLDIWDLLLYIACYLTHITVRFSITMPWIRHWSTTLVLHSAPLPCSIWTLIVETV